jgi:hypothetical protein
MEGYADEVARGERHRGDVIQVLATSERMRYGGIDMKAPTKDLFLVGWTLAFLVAADTALTMAGAVPGVPTGRLSALSAQTVQQEEEDLFLQARRAINREEFEEAANLFAALRTRFVPGRYLADSYYWEAFARYRLGDPGNARILLETLAVYPEAAAGHYDSVQGHVAHGRLHDEFRDLRIRVLRQLAERGDPRAAQEALRQSEAVLQADTARRMTLASLRARQDSAQRAYRRALSAQRAQQDSAQRTFQRALYSQRSRADTAQREYQRALRRYRFQADTAQREYQRTLTRQRSRSDSAQRAYQRALRRHESSADTARRTYQRALSRERSRADSAQRSYQRPLSALRSRADTAQRGYQRALTRERSRADTARRTYQRALSAGEVHPDSARREYEAALEAQRVAQDAAAAEYEAALEVQKAAQDSAATRYRAAQAAQRAAQDLAAAEYRAALALKEARHDSATAVYRAALTAHEAAKDSALRVYRAALATKEARGDSAATEYEAALAAQAAAQEAAEQAYRAAIAGGPVRADTMPRVRPPPQNPPPPNPPDTLWPGRLLGATQVQQLATAVRRTQEAAQRTADVAVQTTVDEVEAAAQTAREVEAALAGLSADLEAAALAADTGGAVVLAADSLMADEAYSIEGVLFGRDADLFIAQQVPTDCEDTSVQQAALTALLRLETDRMRLILSVLERDDECSRGLRLQAVNWLAEQGTDEAERVLIAVARRNPAPDTRQAAVLALASFGTPGAVQALSVLLTQSDDDAVRHGAILALQRANQDGARDALMAFVRDSSQPEDLRMEVLWSLGRRDDVSTESLMALHGTNGFQDLETMLLMVLGPRAQAGDEAVTNWLFEQAMDITRDSDFRQTALEAWSRGTSIDLERVGRTYAQLEEREMKERILYALYRRTQSDADAAPAVVDKMIELARTEEDPETRSRAIYWIGRTGSERAIEFLLEVMREPPKPSRERSVA